MGFFGNLKDFAAATGKALSNGSELLLHAANEMERTSKVMRLRAEIQSFERRIEPPLSAGLTRSQLVGHQQDIIDRCKQVVDILGERHATAEIGKLQSVKTQVRTHSLQYSLARINKLSASSKTSRFKQPVDEILHLQSLVSSCESHIDLLKADPASADDVQSMQVLITQAQASIDSLQPARASIKEIFYNSGSKAALIRLYDGYRQGKSEFWYEDGTIRLTAEYVKDIAEGEVYVYAPSGEHIAFGTLHKAGGMAEWSLQLAPEKVFMTMNLNRDKGEVRVWLWNGVYVGHSPMRAKRFRRVGFFIRLLFKPRVWLSFWLARKPGPARDELERMKSYMAIWAAAQEEVLHDAVQPVSV